MNNPRTRPPWKMGFLGALTDELSTWISAAIPNDTKTIGIPFLGSCKPLSVFMRDTFRVDSWDTQYVVHCAVNGVFKQKGAETNIQEPKLTKGYVYNNPESFPGIEEKCAALIDYIAKEGTLYEKSALMATIARSTYRGRLADWSKGVNATAFWLRFQKRLEYQKQFLNIQGNGVIAHHMANFFETVGSNQYDLLFVDPPKIISTSDVYSHSRSPFKHLNNAVAGSDRLDLITFDPWVRYDYLGKIRQVLQTKSKYLIFVYTSDVRPTVEEIRDVLGADGELLNNVRIKHRSRIDYGLLYRRNQ